MDQHQLAHARDCDHCGSAMPAGWWAWQYAPRWSDGPDSLLLCCRSCVEPYQLYDDLLALDVESVEGLSDLIRDTDTFHNNACRAAEALKHESGEQARKDRQRAEKAIATLYARRQELLAMKSAIQYAGIKPRSASARLNELAARRLPSMRKAVSA